MVPLLSSTEAFELFNVSGKQVVISVRLRFCIRVCEYVDVIAALSIKIFLFKFVVFIVPVAGWCRFFLFPSFVFKCENLIFFGFLRITELN